MTSNELIYKSIHIITEYYNNNLQPFFDALSKDVLWIGPAERQEIRGRDEIVSIFSAEVHELTFTIGSIRATCLSPGKTTHEVILQYECFLLGKHTVKGSVAGLSPLRRSFRWC